jgi:hypothetical protein
MMGVAKWDFVILGWRRKQAGRPGAAGALPKSLKVI